MNKKTIIIVVVSALLLLATLVIILKKRNENEPGEIGGDTSDNANIYPTSTRNFKLSEFKCTDGSNVPNSYLGNVGLLMQNLQILRDEIGLPIIINSGYRSPSYNASLPDAAPNSFHMRAMAADIRIPGMTPKEVHSKILALIGEGKIKQGGVGLYAGFVHYDVRGYKARW